MSIGSTSISEMPIAAQDDPNSKKTPPGQTAPAATTISDPTMPTYQTVLIDTTNPDGSVSAPWKVRQKKVSNDRRNHPD